MTSRLDRLFILLDQGTTSLTRKAAAIQLGEIQKAHPDEFDVLLNRLKKYLYSNSWDTRIAANQAIEAIIKNINWEIISINEDINYDLNPYIQQLENERFSFDNFILENIFTFGKNLFIEKEPNTQESNQNNESNECLIDKLKFNKANKINLNKSLYEFFEIIKKENKVNEESLENQNKLNDELLKSDNKVKENILEDLNKIKEELLKNQNKIKEDLLEDQNKRKLEINENNVSNKRIKIEKVEIEENTKKNTDTNLKIENSWPLLKFANELKLDLFNVKWEIRHGSAIALRDLIKFHGKLAGRISQNSNDQMNNLNKIWLVDLALKLITVLALDKFGDYLSDQVVAPVRETCAQALSSIFNILEINLVKPFLEILIQLLKHKEWQTRHGGLLSLKYLLAIRQDFANDILPIVFEPIFSCLKDEEDDVSSVAASALVPVKDKLFQILPDKIPLVIDYLWDSLLVIDELTSSTSNILILLSSLLAQQVDRDNEKLNTLIPRLWPFLDHTISIVRKSVLDAFIILICEKNSWLTVSLLSDSLRLIFQQTLIEDCVEIQNKLYDAWFYLVSKTPLDNLLNATRLHLSGWLCLLMHPSKLAISPQSCPVWLSLKNDQNFDQKRIYIGGTDLLASSIKEETRINARLRASKFLSLLSFYLVKCETTIPPSSLESICILLESHLCSKSAVQRMCVCWLIQNWALIAKENNTKFELSDKLIEKCFICLQEFIFYDEIGVSFTNVQHETRNFINLLIVNKLELNETIYKKNSVFTFQQIYELLNDVYPNLLNNFQTKTKKKIKENLDEKRKNLSRSLETLNKSQNILINHVTAALSCTLIACKYFPDKLNPIIRPLMESLKKEENENLQMISAVHLAQLIELCNEKNEQPISKIIKNLIGFICSDHNFTPEINEEATEKNEACSSKTENKTQVYYSNEIIALLNTQKIYEAKIAKKNNASNLNKLVSEEVLECTLNDETINSPELIRRGASFAIIQFFKYFKNDVFIKVKPLWQSVMSISDLINSEEINLEIAQKLLQSLQVLEIILPHCTEELKDKLKCLLNCLVKCLECKYSQIRHLASRCIATFAFVSLKETMDLVLLSLLKLLDFSENSIKRQGAIETFYFLIEKLEIKIVPYIVLIVVPMMGRMSDQVESVRTLATQCFAQLVRLMPLDNSKENEKLIDKKFLEKKRQQSEFLEQLLCPKNLSEYKLPIPIKVDLRSYQQDGVNWLAFLNKYRLHGILCDEMGLGKTLMSICMIAADHFYRSKEEKTELPSLVICPSTLTGHWYFEAKKFVDENFLNVVDYSKIRFMSKVKNSLKSNENKKLEYNLVVASYDIVRNDISFFSSISWNYCILDEGHIIKNGKTKLSKAIKSLNANHRLILTGTPIQNNVLELWSLFDFLMPGYLGTERQFNVKYSKPILASRDGKASSKEQETSVFAMESLHAQVLPFILRRMKNDVLQDLPPKIIQDYYCELSPLQSKLYEDFSNSNAKETIEKTFDKTKTDSKKQIDNPEKSHIFQALQYLRKVCNHPKLVLDSNHPQYESTIKNLKEQGSNLSNINNATKLCALKQLLLDCGIGLQTNENTLNEPVVNQHRALIFFQMKSMLEIVQNDLLIKEMPSVTYLRLDGSIAASNRHEIVNKFNNDLSIDVLLLTTHVGGLGLNLTGADTVIFVEHDWNPMKDLQAMDRAHRIGQKKVVNVYRLITSGTLEEKIMGLQRFKLQIANTVISQENSSLQTMGTEQLLDLFQFEHKQQKADDENSLIKLKENIPTSYKSLIDEMPDIWNENQYESEYDLTEFINSFKK